jgi:hypothetical protein
MSGQSAVWPGFKLWETNHSSEQTELKHVSKHWHEIGAEHEAQLKKNERFQTRFYFDGSNYDIHHEQRHKSIVLSVAVYRRR